MSEYPWFSKLVAKYWPEIEALIQPDETIAFKFIGIFEGLGQRSSGVFVITDKNLYMRGKPKTGAFTPVWKMAGGKKTQVIPLSAMYELIDKKKKFILPTFL